MWRIALLLLPPAALFALACGDGEEAQVDEALRTASPAVASPAAGATRSPEPTVSTAPEPRLPTSVVLKGGTPSSVAVNPDTNRIYLTYIDIDVLSVIDGETSEITGTIPLPPGGAHTVAVNPATDKVYLTNPGASSVSVIDGTTNGVVATLALDTRPANLPLAAIAVNPLTNRIYTSWQDPLGRGLAVIDGETDTLIATVNLDGVAHLLAVDTGANSVFAAIEFTAQHMTVCPEVPFKLLAVIDGNSNTVVECVGMDPVWNGAFASDSDAKRLYLFSGSGQYPQYSSTISIIDSSTHGTLATAVFPQSTSAGVAVNPRTQRVYLAVTDWPDGAANPGQTRRLLAADAETLDIISSQPLDSKPTAIAVDPQTDTVYVATADRTLHVIPDSP